MMSNRNEELKVKRDPVDQEVFEDRLKQIAEAKKDLIELSGAYFDKSDIETFLWTAKKYASKFKVLHFNLWIEEIRTVSSHKEIIIVIDRLFNPAAR